MVNQSTNPLVFATHSIILPLHFQFQKPAGMALFYLNKFLGGAFKQNATAAAAAFWSKVYYVVGYFYYIHVVLNNKHRIAAVHQFVQHIKQVLYVLKSNLS